MTTNVKRGLVAAILAMEFASLAMSAVSPALGDIAAAFPTIPPTFISTLSTLPALVCMPVGIWSNRIAGRRVAFRRLALIGFSCMLAGGLLPLVLDRFLLLLACRFVFGIGMGLIQPLGATIVFMFFDKHEAEIQSSNDTIMNNIGAIVFQLGGGILCAIMGWKGTFLIYLALIPSFLILVFCMKEPDTSSFVRREQQYIADKGAIHYGWKVWRWCLLYSLFCILFYPLVTQSSGIILQNGYGTAAGASILLTLFTLGGVLGGFLFRYLRQMGQRIYVLVFALGAAGFLLEAVARSLLLMIVGGVVFGVAYGMFTAAIMITAGYSVPQEQRPGVTARLLACAGLGEFFSAFVMDGIARICNAQSDRFSFLFSAGVYILLALFFLKKPKTAVD